MSSRLRWHVAALVLGLGALWPLLHLDGVFTTDEGAYAVQARAVADGGWDVGYAFSAEDPAGRFEPAHGAVVSERGTFWYVQHPLWPAVLAVGARALGEDVGLRVAGLASLVAVATVCWGLAGALGRPDASPWAFWIGASSPVLANAWILWAHAPSAAAAGLLLLAALRGRADLRWAPAAGLAAAVGVGLRAEGLLWAGAVAAGLVVCAAIERSRRSGLLAACVAAAAAGALLAERWWTQTIVGGASGTGASALEGRAGAVGTSARLTAARISLLDGAILDDVARLVSLLALVAIAAGVVVWRRRGDALPAQVAIALGAVLLLVRWVAAPADPSTGLLAAAPVLVLALAWSPVGRGATSVLVVAGATFVLAVVSTQYADGGSFQWGGRFLSPLVPLLAACAGCGVAALVQRPARGGGAWISRPAVATAAVVALLAAQAAVALGVTDRVRRDAELVVARVDALGAPVMLTASDQAARLDWRGWPERCWLAVREPASLADAVAVLQAAGVRQIGYAGIGADALVAAGLAVRPLPDARNIGRATVPAETSEHAFAGCR